MINVLAAGILTTMAIVCFTCFGAMLGHLSNLPRSRHMDRARARGGIILGIIGSALITIAGLLLMAR